MSGSALHAIVDAAAADVPSWADTLRAEAGARGAMSISILEGMSPSNGLAEEFGYQQLRTHVCDQNLDEVLKETAQAAHGTRSTAAG